MGEGRWGVGVEEEEEEEQMPAAFAATLPREPTDAVANNRTEIQNYIQHFNTLGGLPLPSSHRANRNGHQAHLLRRQPGTSAQTEGQPHAGA